MSAPTDASQGRADAPGSKRQARTDAPGAKPKPGRLLRRAEFLAVAKGRRRHQPTLTLQCARRDPPSDGEPRFGLTATRKTGGAVERNRMRRRLREALRRLPQGAAKAGHDYVVVVRREALTASFETLREQLATALNQIHAPRADRPRRPDDPPRDARAPTGRAETEIRPRR
ncbi:MAG: ribonuclease P protein component [Rhizobiales bacterium]|nr:ribonuclease P protein component [Hyphomicrobiales bacterium]